MKAEIDQSGKLEHLSTHTVVAISNGAKKAIYISSSEKIKLVRTLRKSIVIRRDLIHVVFASMIFLVAKNCSKLDILIIDEEYTGKEKVISETLNKLYTKYNILKKPDIMFTRVGKSSPAHEAAINVYKKRRVKFEIIKIVAEDILRLWRF